MNDAVKTTITKAQWLQAYALFVLGNRRSMESADLDREAHRVLGVLPAGERFPGSHLSDALYSQEPADEAAFNEALHRMDLEVAE